MEVFQEEHGCEEVELEGFKGAIVVDLGGGFLWVQHSWEADAEAEVLGFGLGVVAVFAVGGEVGYAGFGEEVKVLDVEAGGGVVVEV